MVDSTTEGWMVMRRLLLRSQQNCYRGSGFGVELLVGWDVGNSGILYLATCHRIYGNCKNRIEGINRSGRPSMEN